MKAQIPTLSLIPLLIFWSGCTSPQVNKSENLPSQLSNDPTALEEIAIEMEPVGETGTQGIAGIPTAADTLQPDNPYTPPVLDYNNLQDFPPAQRRNSTDLPNPEHWQPEELITPQGPVGQPGEPEKIVSTDPEAETHPSHPELPASSPEFAGIADAPEATLPAEGQNPDQAADPAAAPTAEASLDNETQPVLTSTPRRPYSPYGEATTRPIFLPSDPARFSLPDLLSWLDRHNIDRPQEFADSTEALNWLRQRLHPPPEGSENDQRLLKALLSWMDSGNGPANDHPSNPVDLAASFPWQFSRNANSDADNESPVMLTKAARWLHHPSLQANTKPAHPNTSAPSNLTFLKKPSPTASSTPAHFPKPSVDYTATLHWLQMAAQSKTPERPVATKRQPNLRPSTDHSEALRWLQKASGKKAPLHASILSQGDPNP